jgi:cytochrome P450
MLPRPLPLFGHALHLLRDPWTFLESARPLDDVVPIRLGPSRAYIVNSPDLVRRVLVVAPKTFGKGVQFDKLRPILGNGLVTAPGGEEHLRHRRLVQPAFHHTRIAGYATIMRNLASETADSWHDGQQLAIDREMAQLTMRVVGKALFSAELGGAVVDEVIRSMPIVLGGVTKRALAPTALLEKLPTAGNRRFHEANLRLRLVVDRLIAQYRQAGTDHGDMVSMLLLARDDESGAGLTDSQVRDEVITMLLAGTETTANALCWALHILGERPDIEVRLHAEIDAVLGDSDDLSFDQIGQLDYTRRVVSEVLRLYPPAWLLTRRTEERVSLGDVEIPAGASVLISPYAMHRDPQLYRQPDVFDPDRWLPERAKEIARPAFLPFGAGNRRCIGEAFAWTEAVVVLATIAGRWWLRPVPGVEVRKQAAATLTPSQLPMVARSRERERRVTLSRLCEVSAARKA